MQANRPFASAPAGQNCTYSSSAPVGSSYTPERRPLVVRREQAGWVAKCGDGPEARSELLDLALIEAIHRDHDVVGHAAGVDYGKWARETADSIEREYTEKH